MTSRDFAFWLQGYLELSDGGRKSPLSGAQVETVARHLALVFIHEIDPSLKAANARLEEMKQKIHDGALDGLNPIVWDPSSPFGPQIRC